MNRVKKLSAFIGQKRADIKDAEVIGVINAVEPETVEKEIVEKYTTEVTYIKRKEGKAFILIFRRDTLIAVVEGIVEKMGREERKKQTVEGLRRRFKEGDTVNVKDIRKAVEEITGLTEEEIVIGIDIESQEIDVVNITDKNIVSIDVEVCDYLVDTGITVYIKGVQRTEYCPEIEEKIVETAVELKKIIRENERG